MAVVSARRQVPRLPPSDVKAILWSHLSLRQKISLKAHGYIDVKGNPSGQWWRLDAEGYLYGPCLTPGYGHDRCIHVRKEGSQGHYSHDYAEKMLALKLAIEADDRNVNNLAG